MNPLYVTSPSLPPLQDFIPYLQKIWDSKQLTNGGTFHQQLETDLANYFGVPYVSLFSNGALALIVALKALELKGEVITTPFSFVATTHAIKWAGLTPVFADVDLSTYNLLPTAVEKAVTSLTSAVLPVHCYGIPCDIDGFDEIHERHPNVKIVYDAAHTFGAKLNGQSLASFGDLAVLSFHATKVFTTFEGGAIICQDADMKRRIDQLKNFGINGETEVNSVGINAKMSEVQAAFGLLQLITIDQNILKRQYISQLYDDMLSDIKGIQRSPKIPQHSGNGSYYPILVNSNYSLDRNGLYNSLKENGVFSRRYFYPLISNLPIYSHLSSALRENLPNANLIADQVLCLPIYPDMTDFDVSRVVDVIHRF